MNCIVRVSAFTKGGKAVTDKNGNPAVYLTSIAGAQIPSDARVLAGTVAMNQGFKAGTTVTCSIDFLGKSEPKKKGDPVYNRYQHSIIDANAGASVTNALLASVMGTANAVPTPEPIPADKP